MDNESYELLNKLNLKNIILIKLSDFEDPELLEAKKGRSQVEYCWTCTPSLPLYVLKMNPDIDMISYLDADLFFFYSPEKIFTEFGNDSIMIIPHSYSDSWKFMEKESGIFNVGMLSFKNDSNALECLMWWRKECLKWCYNRFENGKFGDQLYLNDWPTKFKKVHVLKNNGANVALWNIDKYYFEGKISQGIIWQIEKYSKVKFPLIFYHFHGVNLFNILGHIKALSKDSFNIKKDGKNLIFNVYSKSLKTSKMNIEKSTSVSFNYGLDNIYKYVEVLTKNVSSYIYKVNKNLLKTILLILNSLKKIIWKK